MSNIQAVLRALLGPELTLPDLVARTNDLIHKTTPSNKYVTAIFLLVDPVKAEFRFVNAGHNQGILLRADGSIDYLKTSGLPVGLMPTLRPYPENGFKMASGDLVAIFSDGVPEANNRDEQEYGDDRLLSCLKAHAGESAESIVASIFDEVTQFAGDAPQFDDITLMVLKLD